MIDTLKTLLAGLTSWLSGLLRTKNTSEAGLSESTGNGKLRSNSGSTGIDWNTIIIFIIFGVAMYLVPSPFQRTNTIPTPIPAELPVPGIPDTVYITLHHYSGKDSVQAVQSLKIPQMVELVTDKEDKNAHVYIRTSAYPSVEGDSLHLTMWHEYNIQPRALEITRVDTIKVPYAVVQEVDVPFYEKPAFTIPVTAAATAGLIYLILRAAK